MIQGTRPAEAGMIQGTRPAEAGMIQGTRPAEAGMIQGTRPAEAGMIQGTRPVLFRQPWMCECSTYPWRFAGRLIKVLLLPEVVD